MFGHKGAGWATSHGYECAAKGCGRRISRDRLEEHITGAVFKFFATSEVATRLAEASSGDVSKTLRRYEEASERVEDLGRMFGAGELTKPEWRVARAEATKKLTAAEQQLAEHRGALAIHQVGDREDLMLRWGENSMRWQRDIVSLVIERIDIDPAKRPGVRWEPDRVSVTWRV
jgi:hypothetical protein